jgi:acetolactate synthase-1/2/3 large subunit
MIQIKKDDRFIISSQGDMGFELPASIGTFLADKTKMVIPIMGEGSFQLNIQELQTIAHHQFPIKIFVFNNSSYGAIQITQSTFFGAKYGVDASSGLSFPSIEKIAAAYGIKYISCHRYNEIKKTMWEFIETKGEPVIYEIFCCVQPRYPKLSAMKNDDGTFTNRPLEDLEPFLPRDEFVREMIVDIV